MTPEQYAKVLAAVRAQVDRGTEIARGTWGVTFDHCEPTDDPCACALGCLAREEGQSIRGNRSEVITKLLGCDVDEMNSFVDGFDDNDLENPKAPDWFAAGRRMAKEVL